MLAPDSELSAGSRQQEGCPFVRDCLWALTTEQGASQAKVRLDEFANVRDLAIACENESSAAWDGLYLRFAGLFNRSSIVRSPSPSGERSTFDESQETPN